MKLVHYTREVVGKPYNLGSADPDKGLDCFSLVYVYLKKIDSELLEQVNSVSLMEYGRVFEQSPIKAKKAMLYFFEKNLTKIKPNKSIAGDILLLSLKSKENGLSNFFPAINAGNGQAVLANPEVGITVIGLESYDIRRAYRCQQQYQ